MNTATQSPLLLSLNELIAKLHLSKTTIYALLKKGQFPKPFIQKHRCTRWRASDIESWLSQQELN